MNNIQTEFVNSIYTKLQTTKEWTRIRNKVVLDTFDDVDLQPVSLRLSSIIQDRLNYFPEEERELLMESLLISVIQKQTTAKINLDSTINRRWKDPNSRSILWKLKLDSTEISYHRIIPLESVTSYLDSMGLTNISNSFNKVLFISKLASTVNSDSIDLTKSLAIAVVFTNVFGDDFGTVVFFQSLCQKIGNLLEDKEIYMDSVWQIMETLTNGFYSHLIISKFVSEILNAGFVAYLKMDVCIHIFDQLILYCDSIGMPNPTQMLTWLLSCILLRVYRLMGKTQPTHELVLKYSKEVKVSELAQLLDEYFILNLREEIIGRQITTPKETIDEEDAVSIDEKTFISFNLPDYERDLEIWKGKRSINIYNNRLPQLMNRWRTISKSLVIWIRFSKRLHYASKQKRIVSKPPKRETLVQLERIKSNPVIMKKKPSSAERLKIEARNLFGTLIDNVVMVTNEIFMQPRKTERKPVVEPFFPLSTKSIFLMEDKGKLRPNVAGDTMSLIIDGLFQIFPN